MMDGRLEGYFDFTLVVCAIVRLEYEYKEVPDNGDTFNVCGMFFTRCSYKQQPSVSKLLAGSMSTSEARR